MDKYSNDIEIFHYNNSKNTYKKLSIAQSDKEGKYFFTIIEGKKGEKEAIKRVALLIDKKELAFLILELEKLYNK